MAVETLSPVQKQSNPNTFDCGCVVGRRTIIDVGKARRVRNRLQHKALGVVSIDPYPWANEFASKPHNHLLRFSVWYMPKSEIGIAEATLIDILKPIRNRNDHGYGDPSRWAFRMPDADGLTLESIEPSCKCKGDRSDEIRNEPGVYAWWVDPEEEILAAASFLPPELLDKLNWA